MQESELDGGGREPWAGDTAYRRLIEHVHAGVVVHGADTRVLVANGIACALLGLTLDQIKGKAVVDPAWRFLREDGSEMPVSEYPVRRVADGLRPVENLVVGVTRPTDGDVVWALVDAFPELGPDGGLCQIVVTFVDITRRKRAQAELAAVTLVSQLFGEVLPLADVFSRLAEGLANILQFPIAALELHDAEKGEMVLAGARGLPEAAPGRRVAVGQSLSGEVATSGAALQEQIETASPARREAMARLGAATFVCVPVVAGGKVAGTLTLADPRPRANPASWAKNLATVAAALAREIDRHGAEEALRASEEKYRRLHESMTDAFVTVGKDGRILEFNRAYQEMLGYPPEELRGLTYQELTPPAWHEMEERLVREQILVRGYSDVYEKEYRRKDGSVFPVELSSYLIRDGKGEPSVMWGIARDITDRKRAEEALQATEERFRIAADAANLGTWRHDLAPDAFRMDERARELFGFAGSEVPFEELIARFHPEDRDGLRAAMAAGLDPATEGRRLSLENRIVLPDEEVRWVSTFVRAHFEGQGAGRRPVFSVGTVQDVTARKKGEESLLRSQKLEALGTLAGGVAHDINNILMAIRGNASLAASDLPPGHRVRTYVAEIDRAGIRAAGVVKRILSFARPQSSEKEVQALRPVVEESLKLLRATIPALIEITSRWDDSAPPVLMDAGQVQQAVVNLVSNAADAIGPNPGRIEVRLGTEIVGDEASRAETGLGRGLYARLSVTDDGPGMDRETRDRAFDPFFTTKESGKGTGLGLSIVHGIVQGHGGTVILESRPGQGTAIHLYFTAAKETAGRKGVPVASTSASRARTERLLLVDDDEALVFLMKEMLGRLGYRVTSFIDPVTALEAFRAAPDGFDGLITDVSMPRMSGFEVAGQVLSLRPGIPVVVTSGYIRPEDEIAARRLGVRAVILKPNTVDEMAGELDRIFRA